MRLCSRSGKQEEEEISDMESAIVAQSGYYKGEGGP